MSKVNVVLVSPRIPGNVGSIGRTCVGFGARLHVCGPLGFALNDKELRRAKIDYWDLLDAQVYHSWAKFEESVGGVEELKRKAWFFSARARKPLDGVELVVGGEERLPTYLVFGSEASGLATLLGEERMRAYDERMVLIPMEHPDMRCHNLATSVAIALWEHRQQAKHRQ